MMNQIGKASIAISIYQGHRIKFVRFLKQYSVASCAVGMAICPYLMLSGNHPSLQSGSGALMIGGTMLLNVASTALCQNLLKRYVIKVKIITGKEENVAGRSIATPSEIEIETFSLFGGRKLERFQTKDLISAPEGTLIWQWKDRQTSRKFMIDVGAMENKEFCRLVRQIKANYAAC